MTTTYDPTLDTDTDLVRFTIGETDITISIISDEEINAVLVTHPDVLEASLVCARALAARTAFETTRTLGPLTIEARRHDHYTALVADLEHRLTSYDPVGTGSGVRFALTGTMVENNKQHLFEVGQDDPSDSPVSLKDV